MTERCRHLARWISEGRRYFLEHHLHKIWKRHQECGFVLACDGSEDNKLHFRDVNECFFHLTSNIICKAKMTSTCRNSFRCGISTSCPCASILATRTQTQKMNVWTMKCSKYLERSERVSVSRSQSLSQNPNQRRSEKLESQKRMLVSQDHFQIQV